METTEGMQINDPNERSLSNTRATGFQKRPFQALLVYTNALMK